MTYLYEHPTTGEVIEVSQGMNDVHEFFGDDGVKWNRVFTLPQVSMDTKLDAFSAKDFIKKTDKTGTIGDLADRAQELSEIRKSKNGGVDPVLNKTVKDYKRKYNLPHPSEIKPLK
jgi:hypothetical protein